MRINDGASAPVAVLQMGPIAPWLSEALRSAYDVHVLPDGEGPRLNLLGENGARIRVLVASGRVRVDDTLLASLPRLGLVANLGVGYDNVDIIAARRRGILVTNTPDVLTDAVAELALALALAVVRRIVPADRHARTGRWEEEGPFQLTGQLSGAHVGILGLGRIGRAVADRLKPFGCTISYHSRRRMEGVPYAYAASVIDLARSVDLMVVAVPGDTTTRRIVGRDVLEALGPEGVLVNVARGSVVDEEALVELLMRGRLGGAGLDVYAHEPRIPSPLAGLDSVVLLPHVGSATTTTRRSMGELLLRNVSSFLETGSTLTPVPECSA